MRHVRHASDLHVRHEAFARGRREHRRVAQQRHEAILTCSIPLMSHLDHELRRLLARPTWLAHLAHDGFNERNGHRRRPRLGARGARRPSVSYRRHRLAKLYFIVGAH